MLQHTRTQARTFLGKEMRKSFRSGFLEARLARALEDLHRETIPPLEPTVWVKGKNGMPGHHRVDKRRLKAVRAMRAQLRALIPLDQSMNENQRQFPERPLDEIPLIELNTSDEEGDGLIGRLIHQEESDRKV